MSALIIRPVSPFAAATLIPIPLLALGGLFGGFFIMAALLYMTLLRMLLDRLVATARQEAGPGCEFPAAERLSRALAWAHFPLLAIGVAGLSGMTGLGFWEGLGVLLAFGLYFGQVSNSNAHELIHRRDRGLFRLGKWVLISLLYGHHVTAHLKIHHRFVATPDDPNTARLGEGFWSFAPGAWAGAFVAGWEIERAIAKVKERELPFWQHPYAEYVAGGLGFALAAAVLFGASGLIAYLMLAAYAQLQLLLSDYVQHYGLCRRRIGDDRYEQVAPWHSWNAAHWFSGGLMLNAPRHSEHHTNPARPFPELALPAADEGPRLPYSLPVMGAVALVPPLWRRLMDRRAVSWQERIDAGAIERRAPPPLIPAPVRPAEAETEAGPAAGTATAEPDLAEVAVLAEVASRAGGAVSGSEAGEEAQAALPEPAPAALAAAQAAGAVDVQPGADEAAPGEAEDAEARGKTRGETWREARGETPEAAAGQAAPEAATARAQAETAAETEAEPETEAVPEGVSESAAGTEAQHLMRRLEAAEAAFEAAAAEPPGPPQRPASPRPEGGARTPDLWAGKEAEPEQAMAEAAAPEPAPGPEGAPAFRSARSAALFQPDEAEMVEEAEPRAAAEATRGAGPVPDMERSGWAPDPEPEPEPETWAAGPAEAETAGEGSAGERSSDDGIAAAVARLIASGPKPPPRGRMLPSIDHEPELPEPGLRERARRQLHGAALAARALAAVLRGAPPARPEDEEED